VLRGLVGIAIKDIGKILQSYMLHQGDVAGKIPDQQTQLVQSSAQSVECEGDAQQARFRTFIRAEISTGQGLDINREKGIGYPRV
jgi:hypothetical protein